MAEGVHSLYRLGLPVGDDVALVLVQTEVRADVDVEVVLVAFIAEQGVRLGKRLGVHVVLEPVDLALLVREAPGVEVEVEGVMVHDVLLESGDAPIGGHLI